MINPGITFIGYSIFTVFYALIKMLIHLTYLDKPDQKKNTSRMLNIIYIVAITTLLLSVNMKNSEERWGPTQN